MVKVVCLAFLHSTVDIKLLTIISNSLLHYFSALAIKHTFMCHLLVPVVRVIVKLMTLCNFLTVRTLCSLGLCLVDLGDWLSIWSHLCSFVIGLHLESLVSAHAITEATVHVHHSTSHILHYSIDAAAEHAATFSVEKRIIFKWVTDAKTFKHLVGHLIHLTMMTLHHGEHIVMCSTHS